MAVKPGYQRFESDLTFVATSTATVVDTVYNLIGNIYLFPIGASAPTYTFTLQDNFTLWDKTTSAPTWGSMIAQAKDGLTQGHSYQVFLPSAVLVITILSLYFIGDRLGQLLNVRESAL